MPKPLARWQQHRDFMHGFCSFLLRPCNTAWPLHPTPASRENPLNNNRLEWNLRFCTGGRPGGF